MLTFNAIHTLEAKFKDKLSGEWRYNGCNNTRCLCKLQVFDEGSPSRCVAVQMHNLQHKFLHWTLHRQKKTHVTPCPEVSTRVALVQVAIFYLHRKASDRCDKIGRLLQLALGDLHRSEAIEELSKALSKCGVDINAPATSNGEKHELSAIYR